MGGCGRRGEGETGAGGIKAALRTRRNRQSILLNNKPLVALPAGCDVIAGTPLRAELSPHQPLPFLSSTMIQLTPGDWLVIALYGVAMFGVALWALPKIKDCGAFFVGSRKMGKLMMVAAAFAGGTNANHPMAVAAASFQRGMSGIWLSLTWVLITPFFWMFPPAIRRLRIVTVVDIVRMRFGGGMAGLFKAVSLVSVPVGMGLGIKSAAVLLEVMTGGAITGNWALATVCVPTIAYTLMGGVIAAYATDIFQGLLIVVLSFLLIPFAVVRAGGVAQLDAAIDDQFTSLFAGASFCCTGPR